MVRFSYGVQTVKAALTNAGEVLGSTVAAAVHPLRRTMISQVLMSWRGVIAP